MGQLLLFSSSWEPQPTRAKRKRTPTPPLDEHEEVVADSDHSSVSVSSETKLNRQPSVGSLVSYSSFQSKNTAFSKRRSSFLSVGFAVRD